jgi:hypothetical protein
MSDFKSALRARRATARSVIHSVFGASDQLGSPAHRAVCLEVGCQYATIVGPVNTFPLPSGLLFSSSGVVSVLRRPSSSSSDEHAATAPVHQAGKVISSLTVYHAGHSKATWSLCGSQPTGQTSPLLSKGSKTRSPALTIDEPLQCDAPSTSLAAFSLLDVHVHSRAGSMALLVAATTSASLHSASIH